MRAMRRRALGISLIEAMVALAVMGFGTLAVLGVQTTLRMNGDIARQRSEAVRIGQEELQQVRAWATLDDYLAFTTLPDAFVDVGNTRFTVRRTVVDTAAVDANQPRRKTLVLDVGWTDRTGQEQGIRLSSAIHGAAPVLAGSLAFPADRSYTRNPGGRHRAVPREAENIGGDGLRSRFAPPSSGDLTWVFDNITGYITSICTDSTVESCTAVNARLLAGHVRFATVAAPTAPDAEAPPGTAVPIDVSVTTATTTVPCYERLEIASAAVAYYCAVVVNDDGIWSGQSSVVGRPPTDLPLAGSRSDPDDAKFQVCRYTPVRGCHPAVGSTIWGAPAATASCTGAPPTPGRTMRNVDHPRDYLGVTESMLNQNFLVIRAGDGTSAYDCPPDDTTTPFVNTNTWHHQPAS